MVGAPTFLQDLAEHPDRAPARRLVAAPVLLRRRRRVGRAHPRARARRSAASPSASTARPSSRPSPRPTPPTPPRMGIDTEGRADRARRAAHRRRRRRVAARRRRGRGPGARPGVLRRLRRRARSTPRRSPPTAGSAPATSAASTRDGYLRITGRLKDIVIRKGEKISVRELEELIAAPPGGRRGRGRAGAARCAHRRARLRRRDPARRRRGSRSPSSPRFLRAGGVAAQKLPEQLEIVAELPRTESGKVHRAALKARYERRG